MNKTFKRVLGTIIVLAMVLSLAGCGAEEEKTIIIGEGDWDSNAFQDQVVKVILESGYDVKVDVVSAETTVVISSMKTETIDVCLELWSSTVLTYEDDIANGYYKELALNFNDNRQGLYVPRYLVEGDNALAPDLKTVKDLKKYPGLFENPEEPERGIIYGGPEGWTVTEFLYKKMEEYDMEEIYDFKTIDSSATLAATLSGAYLKEEPWVGYYWEPTWVLGLYDMVLLEDSPYNEEDFEIGIGAFPTVDVTVIASPKFIDENPELAKFFGNYHTNSKVISEALAYMKENNVEADVAAKWFLMEKQDLWKTWVDDEVFDKVLVAIKE